MAKKYFKRSNWTKGQIENPADHARAVDRDLQNIFEYVNDTSASGYSGYSGLNGAAAASGYSGYSGSGVSGWSGRSGYSGFSGAAVSLELAKRYAIMTGVD